MNEHDSDKIGNILSGLGYVPAQDAGEADLILFNTCTVREHAHHKAISEIGRAMALKKKRPELIVGVCGCVAQLEKGHLFEIFPDLDLVVGPDRIAKLPELLENAVMLHASCFMPQRVEAGSRRQETGKIIATELIDDPCEYNWGHLRATRPPRLARPRGSRGGRASDERRVTSFVTIMKGCNNNCSFCIVPLVRGKELSRPADDVIMEIKALVEQGVKEVTLLGQNVNSYASTLVRSYSRDSDSSVQAYERTRVPSEFVQLIRRISNETDILRIRYTSPHPKDLSDDLIEEHAVNSKLCRHMHLPLQAGSDKILRAMQRSYNKRRFLEKAAKLRERVPGIEITTDLIVGFPGETECDFQDTLEAVREVAFDGMFAFKYSTRPGTKAAKLKDDVPMDAKEDRLQRLLALNAEIWKAKTSRLVGTVQNVLVEGLSKKQGAGVCHSEGVPTNVGTTEESPQLNRGDPSSASGGLRMTGRLDIPTCQLTGRTFGNKIVNFAGNLSLIGHIVPAKIIKAGANSLGGELV